MTQESSLNRDSFVFYRSFFESMEDLKDKEKLNLFEAICNLALNDIENELNTKCKSLFTLIKPQINANKKRQQDGKNGGRPKKYSTESDDYQNEILITVRL